MVDRTYYRLVLPAGLPPAAVQAAASAFTEDSWSDSDLEQAEYDSLPGEVSISIEEAPVGGSRVAAEAVHAALAEVGQDVAFRVSEAPKYEWLGRLVRYNPQLGWHGVDCDAEDNPVLTDQVFEAAFERTTSAAAGIEELRAILGTKWNRPG